LVGALRREDVKFGGDVRAYPDGESFASITARVEAFRGGTVGSPGGDRPGAGRDHSRSGDDPVADSLGRRLAALLNNDVLNGHEHVASA
jgi:hypothetical protein